MSPSNLSTTATDATTITAPIDDPRRPVPSSPGILSPRYLTMTVAIVMLEALYAFEALGVATAMPTVATALDGLSMYAMAFGATLAASVVGMVAGGQWADASAAHPPLKAGIVAFVLGLLCSGLANDMGTFILGRAAQGLGGGLLSVALYLVVAQAYPPRLHARMFAAAWVVSAMVGPALSGLIVEHLHWRLVFLSASAGTLMVAPMVLDRVRKLGRGDSPRDDQESPMASRLLWAVAAAAGVLMLHPAARAGTWMGWIACVAAVALLVLACRRLLPIGTLTLARGLPTVIGLRGLASASFFGTEALLPLMLSREQGFGPAQAGMALTLGAISWSLGAWLHSRMEASSPVRVMRIGLGLLVTGTLATAVAARPDAPVAVALCGWVAAGLGMGLTRPTLATLTLALSPAGQQGSSATALQLFDAQFTAIVLAISGGLIAAWLSLEPTLAYASILAVSSMLALLALAAAGRAWPAA